jgi:hypothetical protein
MTFGTNYREDVVLTNGLRIRFRTVTPSDKQKLAESFAHLSAESRYRRFFSTKIALTPAELQFFTEPDGIDHVAIAAVEIDTSGEEDDGIGIGRFLRVPEDPEVAEIAGRNRCPTREGYRPHAAGTLDRGCRRAWHSTYPLSRLGRKRAHAQADQARVWRSCLHP